jgi:hypothetical protein
MDLSRGQRRSFKTQAAGPGAVVPGQRLAGHALPARRYGSVGHGEADMVAVICAIEARTDYPPAPL